MGARGAVSPDMRIRALLDRFLPQADSARASDVFRWRQRLLIVVLLGIAALGLLAYGPSVYVGWMHGGVSIVMVDTVAYGAVLGLLFGRRLPYRVRAGGTLVITWALAIFFLAMFGPFSAGPLWLLGASTLSAVLFRMRAAVASLAGSIVLSVLLGLGLALDLLHWPHATTSVLDVWIVVGVNLIALQAILTLPIAFMLRGIERAMEQELLATRALSAERTALSIEVADRRRAEETVMRLAAGLEQAAEAILVVRLDGAIVYCNAAVEAIAGRRVARGERLQDVLGPSESIAKALEGVGRGESWRGRWSAERDGTRSELTVALAPARNATGTIVEAVALARDVTREVELEALLRQSEKLEAIGRLAAGIAHDFNNLLVPILTNTQLASSRTEDPESRSLLADASSAAQRASELVRRILLLSRQVQPDRRRVAVGPVVEEVVRLLRATLPTIVQLEIRVDDPTSEVLADVAEVHQIVMNLATNAVHAMRSGGGSLRLVVSSGPPIAEIDSPRGVVRIAVTDSGEGMDAPTLSRIFEPFFTTRGRGEGTGLGLATVHGVTADLGGRVIVESEVGAGSRFIVELPRAAEGAKETRNIERSVGARPPPGTLVLLVEDQDAVRRAARRVLTKLDCEVLEAVDGQQALLLFAEHRDEIDAMITDYDMPGIDGVELARRIHQMRSDLPIVLTSGHVEARSEAARAHGCVLLSKPFTLSTVGAALARACPAEMVPASRRRSVAATD